MATALKRKLSGSTDGLGIELSTTSTPGDLIHTAVAGTTAGTFDEVWIEAVNNSTAAIQLTLEWGSHDHAQNIIQTVNPKSGLVKITDGLILQNGLDINAFASATGITIHGYVNTITD
jgi:hypothetical protein